jgi:hypothetical protein
MEVQERVIVGEIALITHHQQNLHLPLHSLPLPFTITKSQLILLAAWLDFHSKDSRPLSPSGLGSQPN